MPIPRSIAEAPELRLGLQLFLSGFMDLSSSRQVGMGLGPIPWNVVYQYCQQLELSTEQTEDMIYHVRALDEVYIKKKSNG